MDKIQERLKASIEKQDGVDKALENLGEAVKQAVSNHKSWAEAEVRRCHQIIFNLTSERDLAVEQLSKSRKIIGRIKEDLG